ncbi:glycyl-tRNA synthetase beta chain [Hypnocyclicus thermotrophus]|uniref:Glycine--tRNA ligase beta subunit n=1 Tax=Hypnocyclicus thermotrophus TaxID=1627895 RepID=A0AA46DZJ1_9FUSO|nr:glycine--tRNA ligase subunit beta [Hypnocyclicus thermotrophus]TDT71387.1 glycyl-tRNA synthetase beta chain [Hypnocyclicus thermotrophus]
MEILLEIGMEEIPARFLKDTLKNIENYIKKEFKDKRIKYSNLKTYGTPRRLILNINEVSLKQDDFTETNIGPSKKVAFDDAGEPTKACLGFVKSQGIDVKDLEIIDTEKGEYIGVKKHIAGVETKELIPNILKECILNINFKKSMKWGTKKLRFARPIRWILAMMNDELINFEIEGIKTELKSFGHRFFGSEFKVESIEDYFKKIKENNVIIDIEERKNKIVESIKSKCTKIGEKVLLDEELLDEVTNLVEYPYPIVGRFNSEFLEVPQEVLIITMQVHQRYFPILDENGKLLPKFVVIRNGIEDSENVKKGNEKVIGARLSDARFFFNEDLKRTLDSFVEDLKNVVYQKDLGTIYEKVERNKELAKYLLEKLDIKEIEENILRTVHLSKADLVSNMIGEKEYTKLQGFMGKVYAEKAGEDKEVALGIEEHYYPRYQGDKLPTTLEGALTGIVDKIDTLVGCFGVGLIPTGSKDPYALRRATLGIINVILNSKLNINLLDLVNKSLDIYEKKNILKSTREEVLIKVKEFIKQRIINVFTDLKYSKDFVNAIVEVDFKNIIEIESKLKALVTISKNDNFDDIINLVKRIENIAKNYQNTEVKEELLIEEKEKELYNYTEKIKIDVKENLESTDYNNYFDIILNSKGIINEFFNNVMVMEKDENIKNNRLALLKSIYNEFSKVADLKYIE